MKWMLPILTIKKDRQNNPHLEILKVLGKKLEIPIRPRRKNFVIPI
jgi:hypothetical protein